MDKRIFMVMLFSFLVCISVIVLLTCIWKLIKLFAKVKVEKQIEDLEALSSKDQAGKNPDEPKSCPARNVYLYMSPKEARNLRRLSILAGFDRTWSLGSKSVSCSPFRSRSNTMPDKDWERVTDEDNCLEITATDLSDNARSHNKCLRLLVSVLTCGCCIPIHERLSNVLLPSLERDSNRNSRKCKRRRVSSKVKKNSEFDSDVSLSQQYQYKQSETCDEHLELIEKDHENAILGRKGKYTLILFKFQIFCEKLTLQFEIQLCL